MAQNSNMFQSILKMKCPHCHDGDLFCNKNIYKYKGFLDMPDRCKSCNQDLQIEPGFYLGSMYVSYALTIAVCVSVFVAFVVFDAYAVFPFLIAAGITMFLTLPLIIKVSRAIWINFNVDYNPNAISEYELQSKNK